MACGSQANTRHLFFFLCLGDLGDQGTAAPAFADGENLHCIPGGGCEIGADACTVKRNQRTVQKT